MPQKQKKCPKCDKSFFCDVENIAECQCSGITLTTDAKENILKSYSDCLCKECLSNLK